MKKLFYPLTLALTLLATSCTNNQDDMTTPTDPSGKTPISFVGEATTAPARTRAGFEAQTQIALHIRSTKDAQNIRETRTVLNALADVTKSAASISEIEEPSTDNVRYWDDAFGRDAKLSVFAVAVPGTKDIKNGSDQKTLVNHLTGNATWSTGSLPESILWVVSTDQSKDNVIANEDLTYSNNIKDGGANGVYEWDFTTTSPNYSSTTTDGQMKFKYKDGSKKDGPGKFDKGHLIFNHALSRITINVFKGKGFDNAPFAFTHNTNITIKGVPTSGTLDIENGTWNTNGGSTGITKMATTTNQSGATFKLMAQMLPGFVIDGTDTDVLEFTIDNNKYSVTKAMMLSALNGTSGSATSITMGQGKNYVFNLTVDKKTVDVTASVEPWSDVDATNQDLDNSRGTMSFYTGGANSTDAFDLYRLADSGNTSATNWGGNYTDKLALSALTSGSSWTTSWFFENDASYYHFRSVNTGTKIKEDNTANDDYFDIQSGSNDYLWGAPIKSGSTIAYDTNTGYTSIISPAIGSTSSAINITKFHMMSNINVILRTTKTADAIVLQNTQSKQCTVSLTYFYANGQVKIGNGLVTPTGGISASANLTAPTTTIDESDNTYKKTEAFTYSVVPQALVRTSGENPKVGITIETPDGNKYYIKDLSAIPENVSGGSAIARWLPGRSYTYTFTLTKTGITNVTASVQDWVNVTAETPVTLE